MIETTDEWVLSGFSYPNYLAALGPDAQNEIFKKSSIDLAMRDAFRKVRQFLINGKKLTEDEAISLMSVAVDFGITQAADGNWSVHAIVRKTIFRQLESSPLADGSASSSRLLLQAELLNRGLRMRRKHVRPGDPHRRSCVVTRPMHLRARLQAQ